MHVMPENKSLTAKLDQLLSAARAFTPEDFEKISAIERKELNRLLVSLGQPAPSDDFASAYFNYALTGILETDLHWHILRANPAAASITGHNIKTLCSMHLGGLLSLDMHSDAERHGALLREQGISQTTCPVTRNDGATILVDIASIQITENRFVHVFDDVTAQRQAAAEIEKARLSAETANRAKSEFLANISHEIRTPLNGIIGLSRLTLMTDLSSQQREYLENISQSGRSLLHIINDLLDYAKIEAGRMEFERSDFALHDLLDEISSAAAQVPAERELEIAFHLSPEVPRYLVGDRLRLGQCLFNLLSNAIKFTPAGSVVLEITTATKTKTQCQLSFAVRDTGIGIDEAAQADLFKPFNQADSATARRFGGTGLGLAIARELARGMDGDVNMVSQRSRGSCFTLTLPFDIADNETLAPAAGSAGTALVCCTRAATHAATCAMLEAEGWAVSAPTSGQVNLPAATLIVVDGIDSLPNLSTTDWSGEPPALLVLRGIGEGDLPGPKPMRTAYATRPLTPNALQRALHRLGLIETGTDQALNADNFPQEFRGAHVLVAEDHLINQVVLLQSLAGAGIRTTLARDGFEVLDKLSALEPPPDLILMDVQMPGMDGLEATRRLRKNHCQLPIIGVSAGISSAEQTACTAAGMNDFLAKPIDMDELWGCLTRWVRPRNIEEQQSAESAEDRFRGDTNTLARVRHIFVDLHKHDAALLRTLHGEKNLARMQRLVHTLKGAAATVGATAVASCARTLENLLEMQQDDEILNMISALDESLSDFCAAQNQGTN